MKYILIILSFAITSIINASNYFTSPAGNDNNNGSINAPFFSLNRAWQFVQPGDTVFMRGGIYAYTTQLQCYLVGKSGTAAQPITLINYPGEVPVITKGPGYQNNNIHWRGGVFFSGNYTHWKGINFTGFTHGADPVTGFIWRGLYIENANFNLFEELKSFWNEYGFNLQDNSKGNTFLNCDAGFNWDINTGGGNADGFGFGYLTVTDPANPNIAKKCRSWWNGDDGFDGWTGTESGGVVIFDSCWSWNNGYYPGTYNQAGNGEGFKMGGGGGSIPGMVQRIYKNCFAYHNANKGFEQNNYSAIAWIFNCIAFANANHGININQTNQAHVIRNCASFSNAGSSYMFSPEDIRSNNSGSGSGDWDNNVDESDFLSLDSTGLGGQRINGNLPYTNFLQLKAGSDLIDAGINVGIPFSGAAPDRGCREIILVPLPIRDQVTFQHPVKIDRCWADGNTVNLWLVSSRPAAVQVDLINSIGQTVSKYQFRLLPGQNKFSFQYKYTGVFLVRASGDQINEVKKITIW